jgi:hypothetical protein
MQQLYVFRWNRMDRKGQVCRVLVRGAMNSCLVEFVDDGHKAMTSRNALKKKTGPGAVHIPGSGPAVLAE